jgi:hypothetical protein
MVHKIVSNLRTPFRISRFLPAFPVGDHDLPLTIANAPENSVPSRCGA